MYVRTYVCAGGGTGTGTGSTGGIGSGDANEFTSAPQGFDGGYYDNM